MSHESNHGSNNNSEITDNAPLVISDDEEKILVEELSFVRKSLEDEDRRREVIENKTGQLLGQVSIVISVVSLFIPLISSQLSDLSVLVKILLILLFFAIVIAYLISIWIASSTWIINRYGYEHTELKDIWAGESKRSYINFLKQQTQCLKDARQQHIRINNGKGTKLIQAGSAFRMGTLLLGILVIYLSVVLAISQSKPQEVIIKAIDTSLTTKLINAQGNYCITSPCKSTSPN